MKKYALAYDIGTTGVKTCLFEIEKEIKLIGAASQGYELYVFPDGGAEQDRGETLPVKGAGGGRLSHDGSFRGENFSLMMGKTGYL